MIRTNIIDDSNERESIDLNKLKYLPRARTQIIDKDESDTHYSEMYTVRGSYLDTKQEYKSGEFKDQNESIENVKSQRLLSKEISSN